MKTTYFAACSLDGYIADKNNSLEWLFQFGPPEGSIIEDFVNTVGAIAMGSTTYEWMLEHSEGPWPYNVPCFIFSTRKLKPVPNADIRFVQGDVKPVHAEMVKLAKGKNIWIMGGGELVAKFYDAELLNELQLNVASVTLGSGAPLFPRATKKPLELVRVIQRKADAVELLYKVQY